MVIWSIKDEDVSVWKSKSTSSYVKFYTGDSYLILKELCQILRN
ncbi:hypothetical protein Hdeb2414_s0004g00148321 [Helianthus debilis subsp. tardiflorus]